MEHTIELNDTNTLCIICLEDLDNDIMDTCDNCDIKCHIKCLYEWYIKKNDELCPICLKKTDSINNTVNELFNNPENNDDIEVTVEEVTNNIREIYDNEEVEQIDRITSYLLCAIAFLVFMLLLFLSF